MVLAHDNKVDSATVNVDSTTEDMHLWLLMRKKDCRLLGAIADRFTSLEAQKKHVSVAAWKFPLLECPNLRLVKDLVDKQLTFGLLKPDVLQRNLETEFIRRIEEKGLTILSATRITLSRKQASEFYAEHQGRPFYNELTEYMTSGPSIALIMMGKVGVKRWRDLMGPTDPLQAKKIAPRSLRAKFAINTTRNSCHGSDSWKSAAKEIIFACRNFKMEPHRGT